MITGKVNRHMEATIRLPVRAIGGLTQGIEAVLDTGFNGSLTLPPAVIADLGLRWRTRGLVRWDCSAVFVVRPGGGVECGGASGLCRS